MGGLSQPQSRSTPEIKLQDQWATWLLSVVVANRRLEESGTRNAQGRAQALLYLDHQLQWRLKGVLSAVAANPPGMENGTKNVASRVMPLRCSHHDSSFLPS